MARILVVDDTAQSLALIELYLRGTEFDVVAASDGHAAIEASLQQTFDVILLDVAMPGIDGFEVCRRLDHDKYKVVILTARDDPVLEQACKEAGADAFLTKPFSSIELLDLVEELAGP
jgi:CheY-like chemotaxis protein